MRNEILTTEVLEEFNDAQVICDIDGGERSGFSVRKMVSWTEQKRYRDAACPWAKLSEADVVMIRARKERPYVLARRLGVSSKTIRNARNGATYR